MRILFKNIIEDGSISATNESSNYPSSNIADKFLTKRFKSTSVSSVITIDFLTDQCANSIFYDYHNITSLTAVYKDSLDAVLTTIIIATPEDVGAVYFSRIENIRSIEITINGAIGFYIGGISTGCYFQVPNILSEYTKPHADNSIINGNSYGQKQQVYIKPLLVYNFNFIVGGSTGLEEFVTEYIKYGVGKHLYIDFFENNHVKEKPLYATFGIPIDQDIGKISTSSSMIIEEAR